jgi:hypothetical protein
LLSSFLQTLRLMFWLSLVVRDIARFVWWGGRSRAKRAK